MDAKPPALQARAVAKAAAAISRSAPCPTCGCATPARRASLMKRGAVTMRLDPYEVRWRGHLVLLSPTEAHLLAVLMRRGRASYDALDAAMSEVGAKPATRSLVLLHIRRKFERVGAESPYERLGPCGIRFRAQPDENSSTATIIGLEELQELESIADVTEVSRSDVAIQTADIVARLQHQQPFDAGLIR